jgi:hypothetical protein
MSRRRLRRNTAGSSGGNGGSNSSIFSNGTRRNDGYDEDYGGNRNDHHHHDDDEYDDDDDDHDDDDDDDDGSGLPGLGGSSTGWPVRSAAKSIREQELSTNDEGAAATAVVRGPARISRRLSVSLFVFQCVCLAVCVW